MALILPRSIFFHVPKTGGEWVREAIERAGIPTRETNRELPWEQRKHSHQLNTTHRGPWCFAFERRPWTWYRPGGRFTFAFVRNPLDWYASRWAYKMEREVWTDDDPIDAKCRCDDFQEFMRLLLEHFPGHASDLYELYVGRDEGVVDFVGRQEALASDLTKALRLAGEKFDEAAILDTDEVNVTARSLKWKARCKYTEELRRAVMKADERIMKRFGYA